MSMPSSPRLPSPPPPAEIQISPKSPSMGANAQQAQQIEQTQIDAAAKRRIHPGTKAADMAAGPPLIPLNELDSAFQLQEHLAALHYHHTSGNTAPITRETAQLLATPPPSIDRTLWLYELCRFLIAQCNSLIVGFLFDAPPCSAATCPEMRASEWQFLCAVHDAPKSCCAIDYCCHTLDWAANVVTNPKIFPSRFVAPLGDGHDKGAAMKNLVNVFRRLHRIFAHAWFQHRGVFWSVEGQTGLYVFFKTVCDLYDLLPAENYKLPPEAEGLEGPSTAAGAERHPNNGGHPVTITAIARPPSADDDNDTSNSAAARMNTRRHIRSNPSTGNAISMVPEVDEDEQQQPVTGLAGRMKELSLSSSSSSSSSAPQQQAPAPAGPQATTVGEQQPPEAEAADVPVIVLGGGNDGGAPRQDRETRVETVAITEHEEEEAEPEKQSEQEPVKEEEGGKPSEAEPADVVLENELEKPVPGPSVEPAAAAQPSKAEPGEGEDEAGQVGDDTVVAPGEEEEEDGEEAGPAETESKPRDAGEDLPPVSAAESEDLEEAVAKEDPPAAAAVLAAGGETEDGKEEKSADEGEGESKDEKAVREESQEKNEEE